MTDYNKSGPGHFAPAPDVIAALREALRQMDEADAAYHIATTRPGSTLMHYTRYMMSREYVIAIARLLTQENPNGN